MRFSSLIALATACTLTACQGLVPAPTDTPTPTTPSTPAPTDTPISPIETPVDDAAVPEATYTMEDVAAHATPDDCWIVIRGTVYDVSGYGANHPGGESVYRNCGKDATKRFDTRPDGPGTPHPERANEILPEFAIGILVA